MIAKRLPKNAASAFAEAVRVYDLVYQIAATDMANNTWFTLPVDTNKFEDYTIIVKHPMCLQDVLQRLADRKYSTLEQVESDVEQIWTNAFLYNPSPLNHVHAEALCNQAFFRRGMERIKSRKASADNLGPAPPIVSKKANKKRSREEFEGVSSDDPDDGRRQTLVQQLAAAGTEETKEPSSPTIHPLVTSLLHIPGNAVNTTLPPSLPGPLPYYLTDTDMYRARAERVEKAYNGLASKFNALVHVHKQDLKLMATMEELLQYKTRECQQLKSRLQTGDGFLHHSEELPTMLPVSLPPQLALSPSPAVQGLSPAVQGPPPTSSAVETG